VAAAVALAGRMATPSSGGRGDAGTRKRPRPAVKLAAKIDDRRVRPAMAAPWDPPLNLRTVADGVHVPSSRTGSVDVDGELEGRQEENQVVPAW